MQELLHLRYLLQLQWQNLNQMSKQQINRQIEAAANLILGSQHLVVFTGAGISTESGIPDFRSPGGIWDQFDQKVFDLDSFLEDERSRALHWELFSSLGADASPNPAHFAVGELCKLDYAKAVITQNIDGLHQRGGVPAEIIHELHGTMSSFTCVGCGEKFTRQDVMQMTNQSSVPACPECSGILKPDVVFFGEPLPISALKQAERQSLASDVFLVIGSTLTVYPAAVMPEYALSRGARLIIINLSTTSLDGKASITIRAKAGQVLPEIVNSVKRNLSQG